MINKSMQSKKLTLYKIGNEEYQLSEVELPDAEPLAEYNDISELYPTFYDTSTTYDVNSFTDNSAVSSFYATTPTRTVSDAARASIGAASAMRNAGTGNPQFGTKWIYNDILKESKKIRATDDLPKGWEYGRKIKFEDDNNE